VHPRVATRCLGALHSTLQSNRTVTFFLVCGLEAIIPADIMWQSAWVEMYEEGEANEARQLELDSAEEARCNTLV
jgi:hypothetical protein